MVSISSDVIRGYNDTMILFLLKIAPSYGYEISKNIKALTSEKYVIKETTLYSAFTRMEENGYVESYSQETESIDPIFIIVITAMVGRIAVRSICQILLSLLAPSIIAASSSSLGNVI